MDKDIQIESLRAELDMTMEACSILRQSAAQYLRERDEARQALSNSIESESRQESIFYDELRQANAALLNDIKGMYHRFVACSDFRAADAFDNLLIQYDTAPKEDKVDDSV